MFARPGGAQQIGDRQLKHYDGHGDGEDAIGEGLDASWLQTRRPPVPTVSLVGFVFCRSHRFIHLTVSFH